MSCGMAPARVHTCRNPCYAAQSSGRAGCCRVCDGPLLLTLLGLLGGCLELMSPRNACVRRRRVLVGLPEACQRHACPGGRGSIVRGLYSVDGQTALIESYKLYLQSLLTM